MKSRYSMRKIVSILCALILLIGCFSVLSACQPTHTCQSVCQDCGKCLNVNCVEKACAIKCPGHHVCESLCPTCNKCTDADCVETVCAYKCVGHYVCRKPCPICGKCTHLTNDIEDVEKCQGHDTCYGPCAKCGACNRVDCKIIHNVDPCSCGYPWFWKHVCQNVCEICGLCTNKSCTQEPCSWAQCPGHDVPLELTLANEPVTEWVYTEPTPEEEKMLLQGFSYAEMGEYYGKIGDKYFHCPIIAALGKIYDYSFEGIYLIGNGAVPIFMYYNGENIEIDKAYEAGLLTKDEIVILSHYLIAYEYRATCLANGVEVTEPIKVNVIARIPKCGALFFIGEKPTADSTKTPRIIEAFNIDYTKKSVQYGTVEFPLFIFGGDASGMLGEEIQQRKYLLYAGNVWEFNEYFNLYLESIFHQT